jgi:hypothetical protein
MKKHASSKKTRPTRSRRDPSPFPKGWNRKRIEELIHYYENQSDDDAIAEAEAQYNDIDSTMMQIPLALVPKVERMIARAG